MNVFKRILFTPAFFGLATAIVVLFIFSFSFPFLFVIAQFCLLLFFVFVIIDAFVLFHPSVKFRAERKTAKVLSLGDDNIIRIILENKSNSPFFIELIDELPYQLQKRDFKINLQLPAESKKLLSYEINPKERGLHKFGRLRLLLSSRLRLLQRMYSLAIDQGIPVYPSIIQMRNMELQAFSRVANMSGVKKFRKLGHSYEFEQIKPYVEGDDFRSINWKATGRRHEIMVNQYEDERSQQIYSVISKGRAMKMPFEGLSLLDYAINASLSISNIALRKYDKAGLITFSDKIGTTIRASNKKGQLQKIMHSLYNEKERELEPSYQLLWRSINNVLRGRSLIFLYINFETPYMLDRALPVLQKINRSHLLVLMMFKNTELLEMAQRPVNKLSDIYSHTLTRKLLSEKDDMVKKLRKSKIQTVYTEPENMTVNTVNKYLELKSRGLI